MNLRLVRQTPDGRLFVMMDRHRVYAPQTTKIAAHATVVVFYIGKGHETMLVEPLESDAADRREVWNA